MASSCAPARRLAYCRPGQGGRPSKDSIKGPASYFPSIEKVYGRPIADWQQEVRRAYPARHMELVARLKEQHGLGHGHANAIVAHTLAEDGLR
ncbi:MAG TPA: DUF4287 domain-containing protein [Brevundimonas sp.]|nr:DUF4287 domain-containing protein [Brevundimonas sp.]